MVGNKISLESYPLPSRPLQPCAQAVGEGNSQPEKREEKCRGFLLFRIATLDSTRHPEAPSISSEAFLRPAHQELSDSELLLPHYHYDNLKQPQEHQAVLKRKVALRQRGPKGSLQMKRAGYRTVHFTERPGQSWGVRTGDFPFVCQQGFHSCVTGTE